MHKSERVVLVVDDEKRIADTTALILGSKGYATEVAYDAASALEICQSRVPDLIVSDVVMPGMNGVELGIAVKNRFSTCRVLLFSGQAATADILEEARSRGHDFELLPKPLHPDKLVEKVTELIGPSHA